MVSGATCYPGERTVSTSGWPTPCPPRRDAHSAPVMGSILQSRAEAWSSSREQSGWRIWSAHAPCCRVGRAQLSVGGIGTRPPLKLIANSMLAIVSAAAGVN